VVDGRIKMANVDRKPRARPALRCILPVVVVSIVSVLGFAFWYTAGGAAWRGAVAVREARFIPPDSLEIEVYSCNGAPQLQVLRQSGDTVELEVVAFSTPLRGGDDCLDLLTIQVDGPLTAIVDLHTGETIELAR